jgi:4-hydroxy-tetrahydrodipicolinate reductase
MIKVAVSGALGRTGSLIVKGLVSQEDMKLAVGIVRPKHARVGVDVGEAIGIGRLGVDVIGMDRLDEALGKEKPDILVDYTNPGASLSIVKTAAKHKVNLIVGTTGHSPEQLAEILNALTIHKVSAVMSPNMSTTSNLLFKLAEISAKTLGRDFDVEIMDIKDRHIGKAPTPTGTAMTVAMTVAEVFGTDMNEITVYGRPKGLEKRQKERPKGQICIHAIRGGSGGDDYHEIQVLYAGESQRIVLIGRTDGGGPIVEGTIKAIRFLHKNKEREKIFNMLDVLGLK